MKQVGARAIALYLAGCLVLCTALTGCAQPMVAKLRPLDPDVFQQWIQDESTSKSLLTHLRAVQEKPDWQTCTEPVEVFISVWIKYSGDGPRPQQDREVKRKEGEVVCVWYVTGELNLAETEILGPKKCPGYPRKGLLGGFLFHKPYMIHPADQDFIINVRVYDRDQIGDDKADQIRKLLTDSGAAARNLYPPAKKVIPLIGELLSVVFIDIPNLFLENDMLADQRIIIQRRNGTTRLRNTVYKNDSVILMLTVGDMPSGPDF